jgi:hypothetical protein
MAILSTKNFAQDYNVYHTHHGLLMIEGKLNPNDWIEICNWDTNKISEYEPEIQSCKSIEKIFSNNEYKLYIVAGSWCGDTKSELPKIFRILQECKLSPDKYVLFGVGTDKTIKSEMEKDTKINKVPTMIIIKNGKEIGRIEEFPEDTWENDLIKILEV